MISITKQNVKIVRALVILVLMTINTLAGASISSQSASPFGSSSNPNAGRDIPVLILFDPMERVANATAFNIYQAFQLVYQNLQIFPVVNEDLLLYYLETASKRSKEAAIIIHVFGSSLEGVKVGKEQISWSHFLRLLATKGTRTHHVLGMGNGKQISDALKVLSEEGFITDNIYTDGDSEILDAQLAFTYVLIQTSEIFEKMGSKYLPIALNLRNMGLRFFTDNFSNLLNRVFKPKEKLGEEDTSYRDGFQEEFEKEFPSHIEPLPGGASQSPVRLLKLPEHVNGDSALAKERQIGKVIDVSSEEQRVGSQQLGDFLFGFLPNNSGLQGPMGFVADALLFLLRTQGEGLGIPFSTVQNIFNVMNGLKEDLGIFGGNFDENSEFRQLIDYLRTQFPWSGELSYFQLFVDAIVALRPQVSQVAMIAKRTIDLIFPDDSNSFKSVVNDILAVLDLDGAPSKTVHSSQFLEALLPIIFDPFLALVAQKFTTENLNISTGDTAEKLGRLMNLHLSFVAERNLTHFLDISFPNLMTGLFTSLNGSTGEQLITRYGSLLQMILSYLGFSDRAFRAVLEETFPVLLSSEISAQTDIVNMSKELINVIDSSTQSGESSTSTVKSQLENVLNAYLSLSSTWIDFLADLLLYITAFKNDAFNIPNTFPTISSLSSRYFSLIRGDFSSLSDFDDVARVSRLLSTSVLGMLALITGMDSIKASVSGTPDAFSLYVLSNNVTTFLMDLFEGVLDGSLFSDAASVRELQKLAEFTLIFAQLIQMGWDRPIQTFFQFLLMTVLFSSVKEVSGVGIDAFITFFGVVFPFTYYENLEKYDVRAPTIGDVLAEFNDVYANENANLRNNATLLRQIVFQIKDIFNNGVKWVFTQVMGWLDARTSGFIVDLLPGLANALSGGNAFLAKAKMKSALLRMGMNEVLEKDRRFSDLKDITYKDGEIYITGINKSRKGVIKLPFSFGGTFGFKFGKYTALDLTFIIGLDIDFGFYRDAFVQFLRSITFSGNNVLDLTPEDGLREMLSFLQLIPNFFIKLDVKAVASKSNKLTSFLLQSMGLEFSFQGYGILTFQLFQFSGSSLDVSAFLRIVGWEFGFTISIGRVFTILDLVTGGVGGGGVLRAVAKYIGLELLSITVYFGIGIKIVKKAASASGPEESSLTFKIFLGATIKAGFDLKVVKLELQGTLEIVFTFFQDLAAGTPMQVFFDVYFKVSAVLKFIVVDLDYSYVWNPVHVQLTPDPSGGGGSDEPRAFGPDADGDGLSDEFELGLPGFNPFKADSDGDGLSDKYELQTSFTDPGYRDTDRDGLNDYQEVVLFKTDPKNPDTDFDGLTDYQEAAIYGTNPFELDTDGDGLDDAFEVKKSWDISTVTPSVTSVIIGGVEYNDHTDPLNPDTDGDGLLDGEEGERGIYYGPDALFDSANEINPETGGSSRDPNNPREGAAPIIFNYGYTHPLDNDTDDDSYEQLWNGTISPRRLFLRSMTDGDEIFGQWITFINKDGEPTLNLTRTNPVNPDTDGDTGRPSDFDPAHAPNNLFLNSDGYELALNPPTDPNDGDSDDDGLIDGLEGTLLPYSNHTHYLNPDTDGDGLGDLQEVLLNSNPREPDTDGDMVSDGDEFFVFGTEPFLPDSDFDGLSDGEEIFIFHSNPRQQDSDGDGLLDGDEVLKYGTYPVDEDSDNDGLTDYDEIMIFGTDPRVDDTDGDGLLDGEETNQFKTDPLKWDTDNDSILYLNASGLYTFPLSDGDEVNVYHTNPLLVDSDRDGLSDSWELYLGIGNIPRSVLPEPILLDPMSNDTDGDGLFDGAEIKITNVTSLIYPYISFSVVSPFNSRPDKSDTDGDGLDDYLEVKIIGSDASNSDTDNDSLQDGHEYLYHGTSPVKDDTDGDGLLDSEELTLVAHLGTVPLEVSRDYNPIYTTDANDPDTDGDGLPDGQEINYYDTDPRNPDENQNGIVDGLEYDSDHDLLEDVYEYFGYYDPVTEKWIVSPTVLEAGGGPFNPDSDRDGIADGVEFYGYHTNASNWDTDNDSWSDALELSLGTDPLTPTDNASMFEKLDGLAGSILLLVPDSYPKGSFPSHQMPLVVKTLDPLRATKVWYQVSAMDGFDDDPVVDSRFMVYDEEFDQYESSIFLLDGVYEIKIYLEDVKGDVHQYSKIIQIGSKSEDQEIAVNPFNWLLLGILISFLGGLSFLAFMNILRPGLRLIRNKRKLRQLRSQCSKEEKGR